MARALRLRCIDFVLGAALIVFTGGTSPGWATADELFVADRATNRVLGFDAATGAFTRVLVDEGLSTPTSLVFGPGGFLYVGNLGNSTVMKVDPVTGAKSIFADITLPADEGRVGGVGGLAYDEGDPGDPDDDVLFVSEIGNFDGDEVYRFDKNGAELPASAIGTGSSASGRAGMALRDGDLYVSSFGEPQFFFGTVLKYDGASDFVDVETVASDFSPPATLNGASGLAFDSAGDLYVAGLFSQGVMKFSIDGGPATSGTPFGFSIPYPSGLLTADEGGTEVIYVTSLGNDRLGDALYGNTLFPGAVYKFDVATGDLIGGAPLIASGGVSDHNNDGLVNGEDLDIWGFEFGATELAGADADSDGDADGADFLAWQRNVGKLGDFQPTAVALYQPIEVLADAVPEPSGLALLATAALATGGVRRRRPR